MATLTGWYWSQVNLNGCNSDTSNNVYVLITGMEEIDGAQVNVYPVPNTGEFTVDITSNGVIQALNMQIFNNIGQLIYGQGDIKVYGRYRKQIDLRPIPAGIYTLVLRNDQGTMIRKILVHK